MTVYDAYGATATKLAAMYRAADVETVVFDIQDVGSRFYTYIWTMYDAMVAAAQTGARFVVLDRPNPIGGHARGRAAPVLGRAGSVWTPCSRAWHEGGWSATQNRWHAGAFRPLCHWPVGCHHELDGRSCGLLEIRRWRWLSGV